MKCVYVTVIYLHWSQFEYFCFTHCTENPAGNLREVGS